MTGFPMDDRLRRWLDGEIGRDELPPELRERARRWQALFEDLRSRDPARAPVGLEAEVMRRIRSIRTTEASDRSADASPSAGPVARALRWLIGAGGGPGGGSGAPGGR